MEKKELYEKVKSTQKEMYEYVKALNFISNAANASSDIEFNSIYVTDLIKSMIDELTIMLKDRASNLLQDFGFWESKETESDKFYRTFFDAIQTMTDDQKKELETFLHKLVFGKTEKD